MSPDSSSRYHAAEHGCGHPRTHLADECEQLTKLRVHFDVTGAEIVDLEDLITAGSWDPLVTKFGLIGPVLDWMDARLSSRPDLYRRYPREAVRP